MAIIGVEGFEGFKTCLHDGKIMAGKWYKDDPSIGRLMVELKTHPDFPIPLDINAEIDVEYDQEKYNSIPLPLFSRIQ